MTDLAAILRPALASALASAASPPPTASAGLDAIAARTAETVAADPALRHAANAEPWYQSRVTLGAVVSAAAPLLGLLGLTLTPESRDAIVALAAALGGVVGPAVTLYGRWVARTPLRS